MPNENVKEQLIQAAVKLLSQSSNPGKITARQIVSEANVNLAMINYYFKSKDELMNTAVERIIEERAQLLKEISHKAIPAKQKLIEFLTAMSDILIEYADITRPTIPYLLLEGNFDTSYYILSVIKECFGLEKSETECRIAAYQIVSFFQLVFYRYDEFSKYTGKDITNKKQRDELIQSEVNLLISDNKDI